MGMVPDVCRIRVFTGLDGSRQRLYCRLCQVREAGAASYRLYEDFRGGQWLEITVGGRTLVEELCGESFEQRVAADLLTLGLNKYSG